MRWMSGVMPGQRFPALARSVMLVILWCAAGIVMLPLVEKKE